MRNLTEPLVQDSRAILDRLPAVERALDEMDLPTIRATMRFLAQTLSIHRHDEDDVLLPVLLKHLAHGSSPRSPAPVSRPHEDPSWSQFQGRIRSEAERLHEEHGWLAGLALNLQRAAEPDSTLLTEREIRAEGRRLVLHLRRHLSAELQMIFPVAEQLLTEGEKRALKSQIGGTRHRS